MSRHWLRVAVIAIAAVSAITAACGGGGDEPVTTGPLVLYPGEPNGDDGDWHGFLTVEGECLYVDWYVDRDRSANREPDSRMLVAFPSRNTRWDEREQAVQFDGETLRVGDWVDLGGGAARRDNLDWDVPPDASCDTSNIFMVG